MQLHQYKESQAESWLNRARVLVIEDAEQATEKKYSWWRHLTTTFRAKSRCLAAFFFAIYELTVNSLRIIWYSTLGRLQNNHTKQRQRSWDGLYQALDGVFDSLTGIINVQSILTAADRGNVQRIGELSARIREMGSRGDLHPATQRQIDHWYESAKVFVKEGGQAARSEMKGLSEVLDRLLTVPDARPDKLRGWRWEKKRHGLIKLEKIKGIRWKQPQMTATPSLRDRKWKVKVADQADEQLRKAG